MGIFKKKKDDFGDFGNNEHLFDGILDDETDGYKPQWGQRKNTPAKHALTAKEVNSDPAENVSKTNVTASQSIYNKVSGKKPAPQEDDYVPSWANTEPKETTVVEPAKPVANNIYSPSKQDEELAKKKKYEKEAAERISRIFAQREEISNEKPEPTQNESSEISPEESVRAMLQRLRSQKVEPIEQDKIEQAEPTTVSAVTEQVNSSKSSAGTLPTSKNDVSLEESSPAHKEIKVQVEVINMEDAPIMTTTVDNSIKPNDDISEQNSAETLANKLKSLADEQFDDSKENDVKPFVPEKPLQNLKTDLNNGSELSAHKNDELQDIDSSATVMFDSVVSSKTSGIPLSNITNTIAIGNMLDDATTTSNRENFDFMDNLEEQDSVFEQRLPDCDDVQSANALIEKFSSRCKRFVLTSISSLLLSAIIILLSLKAGDGISASPYIMLGSFFIAVLINADMFKGIVAFFKMKSDINTVSSFTAIFGAIFGITSVFLYNSAYISLLTAPCIYLAFRSIWGALKSHRVLTGLKIISNETPKKALKIVTDPVATDKLMGVKTGGDYSLVTCKKTSFILNYINNSAEPSHFDQKLQTLIIVSLLGSVIIGGIFCLLSGCSIGLAIMLVLFCASFPAVSVFISELPMKSMASQLAQFDAAVSGFGGANQMFDCNTVTVEAGDLFPKGKIKLYNMHTLSSNEIAHTLTAAAAVTKLGDSPLYNVFADILGSDESFTLPEASDLTYEDKMGISGWIGDKRVLIGNRNLLQGHSVKVPNISVDNKILKQGFFPVYVAFNGVPCLLLVVKYEVDDDICFELNRLCNTGMTILFHTSDANLSEKMITDYFELPDDCIKMVKQNSLPAYNKATEFKEKVSASGCYGNDPCGLFAAVSSSIRIKSSISALAVLYSFLAILGIVSILYMAFTSKFSLLTAMNIGAFQLISALFGLMVSLIKRP